MEANTSFFAKDSCAALFKLCQLLYKLQESSLSSSISAVFQQYFTIRRILYQLGGLQNISALPGDPTFSEFNNRYDVASYRRICGGFGVAPSSDFRFTHGKNNGLGNVYQYVGGASKRDLDYPGFFKFSDEGGKGNKGNLIYYIEPDVSTPYDWFAPKNSSRLDTGGTVTHKPVDRGVCLLRASKRKEQHPWRWEESERGPDGVLDTHGRRYQTA